MEEKRRSAGKTILTVLLVILLTVVAFAAYVVIRMAATSIETDDVNAILANEPLPVDERFGTDDEDDLLIRLNRDDLYYFLSNEYGADFLSSSIEEIAKSTGFRIDSYKLEIKGGEPMITVTAKYSFLKLAASTVMKPEAVDGNRIVFKASKIKVAGMSIPISWTKGLEDVKFDFMVDSFLMNNIKDVKGDGDCICLVGDLSDEVLKEVDPTVAFPKDYTYYLKDYREVLDAGNSFAADKKEANHIFMEGVRELGFKKVIEDYFLTALPRSSKAMMRNTVLCDRLLSEYKDTDFVALHQPTTQFVEDGRKNIDRLTDQVFRYFNLKRISIKDGRFYYGDKEFEYEDIVFEGWEDYYAQLIKPETFRLVLIEGKDAFKGNVGTISNHIDSTDSIAEEVDPNGMYTLGYVVETVGGLKTVCYNGYTTTRVNFDLKVVDLTEEEYAALTSGNKVHVYTIK